MLIVFNICTELSELQKLASFNKELQQVPLPIVAPQERVIELGLK